MIEGNKITGTEKLTNWGANEFSLSHEPVVHKLFLKFLFILGKYYTWILNLASAKF